MRRRKWIRYRRYIALNSWCAIAPLHKDPTKEPFIGIAVGGNWLLGSKVKTMMVWAVTAYGRVMFRTDVSDISPEGQRWSAVPVPAGCEVVQVNVGATGLVWVVLSNGKALARIGINRDCPTGRTFFLPHFQSSFLLRKYLKLKFWVNISGCGWVEVDQPENSLMINQISLGYNSVWAISKDSRVWFRKGINGENSGVCEKSAKGSGWVEMIGKMTSISVAANDQVWAVGSEDRLV